MFGTTFKNQSAEFLCEWLKWGTYICLSSAPREKANSDPTSFDRWQHDSASLAGGEEGLLLKPSLNSSWLYYKTSNCKSPQIVLNSISKLKKMRYKCQHYQCFSEQTCQALLQYHSRSAQSSRDYKHQEYIKTRFRAESSFFQPKRI